MKDAALARLGYLSRNGVYEARPRRPRTLAEAKSLIEQTFDRNKWDGDDRKRYLAMKNVEPKEVKDLTLDETRTVIAALEKSHMLLITD